MPVGEMIAGIVRHGLTTLGGGLVAAGWFSTSELELGVGAVATLIGLGWSIVSKQLRA